MTNKRKPERFTPTHVGKALESGCSTRSGRVHPHARGESGKLPSVGAFLHGSPPRTWGKLFLAEGKVVGHRFTPTCVGKASKKALRASWHSVHPHVRGESQLGVRDGERLGGSPPRAWGKRYEWAGMGILARFTPTCVGKAGPTCSLRPSIPVHPHVRGESWPILNRPGGRTVHPHVRGESGMNRMGILARFTPTCVGKAGLRGSSRPGPSTVHPHVRGESADPTGPVRRTVHPHVRGESV